MQKKRKRQCLLLLDMTGFVGVFVVILPLTKGSVGDRFEGVNEREKAKAEIIQRASYGVIFKRTGNHIFIRSGDYIFPCIGESRNQYIIKTILTPELYYAQLNQSYKK